MLKRGSGGGACTGEAVPTLARLTRTKHPSHQTSNSLGGAGNRTIQTGDTSHCRRLSPARYHLSARAPSPSHVPACPPSRGCPLSHCLSAHRPLIIVLSPARNRPSRPLSPSARPIVFVLSPALAPGLSYARPIVVVLSPSLALALSYAISLNFVLTEELGADAVF